MLFSASRLRTDPATFAVGSGPSLSLGPPRAVDSPGRALATSVRSWRPAWHTLITPKRREFYDMDHRYEPIRPTHDDFVPASLGLDRRRFLHVAGIAGLGIAAGGRRVRADDEPLKPAEAKPSLQTTVEEVTKPSPCGNSPLGGPFYPAKTDITPPNDLGPGKGTPRSSSTSTAPGRPDSRSSSNSSTGRTTRGPVRSSRRLREIAPTWCDYANLSMQFVDSGPCHMTVNFQPFSDQFGQHVPAPSTASWAQTAST